MRLIDADVLWEELGILYHQNNGNVTWNDALMEIKTAPTIEPERKKGKWMIHGEPPMYVKECSACGEKFFHHQGQTLTPYCSMCGADMREENR